MEVGLIRKVDIDSEMQQSYLDYAMSVIVSRALPDARDGLKPVQRRILYAMYDMGLRSDTAYKKSARIVGEVLGKYHPHGDVAVYEAMARLAQDFSMRYPLVDGQGNFGSVDGDPPAAMRYTEARLMPLAMEMMAQLDRNTVDFTGNFDDTMKEPLVVPSAIPNLLVNGATGIAVGMATNIPPHNLTEVVDAIEFMLRDWEHLDDINISDLMQFVKGPDFPTGGIILEENGQSDLHSAYATGRGRVLVRGRVHAEDMGRGRSRLIITEIPYMANKASLIERIAELVREGHLDGISDLRDESDRQGMRIVIELSKAAETDDVLRKLYQHTPLQSTFGIHLLALVNNEPRLLTLKQALRVYIEHRLEVVRRRSEFDLEKARQRAHILDGLRIAINNLDEIIALIRNSPDVETARTRMIKRFKLSDVQAQAILDMPLRRLAALERKKIEDEYRELQRVIKELEALLKSPKRMRQVVADELELVKAKYGDKRRTQIVSLKEGESGKILLTADELTPGKDVWVGVTPEGLISRTGSDQPPALTGTTPPAWLVKTNTHHTLYVVTTEGRAAGITVESLPQTGQLSEGYPLYKVAPFADQDRVGAVFAVSPEARAIENSSILTVTQGGMVKKSLLADLPGASTQVFTLVKVNSEDELIRAIPMTGEADIFMVSANGNAIRFSQQDVRPMGLVAAGVNGMKIKPGDRIVSGDALQTGDEIMLVASDGKAWRMSSDEFPVQGRYGQGIAACKLTKDEKLFASVLGDASLAAVAHLHNGQTALIHIGDIALGKRTRAGQTLIKLGPGDGIERIGLVLDGLALGVAKGERTPITLPDQNDGKDEPDQLELGFDLAGNNGKSKQTKEAADQEISRKKPATNGKAAKPKPKAKKAGPAEKAQAVSSTRKAAGASKPGDAQNNGTPEKKSKPGAPTASPAEKTRARKASAPAQEQPGLGMPVEKSKPDTGAKSKSAAKPAEKPKPGTQPDGDQSASKKNSAPEQKSTRKKKSG
jgi:DNA gyrase subunit A